MPPAGRLGAGERSLDHVIAASSPSAGSGRGGHGALLLGGCSGLGPARLISATTVTAAKPEAYGPNRLHSHLRAHIALKVGAAMRGLTQVRVTGEIVDDDMPATVDLALDHDLCELTSTYEFGVAQVRGVQERTYFKGDFGFWTGFRDYHKVSGAAGAWSDRWLDLTDEFGPLCDPASIQDLVPDFDVEEVSEPMVHDGVEAVVITTTDGDRMVAANEAPYRVLQLETSDSDVQFSYDDVVVTNEVPEGVVTLSEAFELPPFEIA